LRNWLRCS